MHVTFSNRYFHYSHRRTEQPNKMEFHLHDRFEIYFFIAGDVNYFIEKKVYPLQYGDLLIMNNRELHKATFRSDAPYENIVIHFDPAVAAAMTSVSPYPLLDCFVNRPQGEHNKIIFTHQQLEEAATLFRRIEQLASLKEEEGSELLLTAYMIELLILLNRVHHERLSPQATLHLNLDEKLAPVLDYIDRHLEQDLTLETLERQFFMNRYYLSRLFKKNTGSTIHEYILLKRISLAKKLLLEDHNVTDACQLSGFNDYSHFIRMFKRIVGVPPGQYRKRE
ncbi:AraC family transcriptional regulator [Paenibacillus sp. P25]|nr:AraC family transcriptional regulator [Paenibacillus sp. P25]